MFKPKTSWPDWLIKCRMPEFWKAWIIYLWPFIYVVWHSIRLKNKFWPVVLNPAIDESGGFVGASKSHINTLFPKEFVPLSLDYDNTHNIEKIIADINNEMGYPCFIKPDNLMRGMGVEKIESDIQLHDYLQRIQGKFCIQKALNQKEEYGVFISRIPGEKIKILSLAVKVFLSVTGDGESTIIELLKDNIRYKLAKKFVDPVWKDRFNDIPNKGEYVLIQPVGNHNKGTYFIDISNKITPAMEEVFDKIVPQKGVYYGRFDIKSNNLHDLETGNNIGIIEFNGTVAEALSYCDSKYHFFKAQKIIMQHFREQLRIAEILLKKGAVAPGLQDGLKLIRKAKQFETENAFTFND